MIKFIKSLFGFEPQQPLDINIECNLVKEKSLNERNRLRAKKEKDLLKKKKKKAQLEREKADKAFYDSATKYYLQWLEEFQFRLYMGADESDLRFTEGDEIRGTITINNTVFSVTTKLGTVSRMSPAVRTSLSFEGEGLEAPMKFIINVIANSRLVGQMRPAVQADKCLDTLKKQAQIITS